MHPDKNWLILWSVSTVGGWLLGGMLSFIAHWLLRSDFGFTAKTETLETIVIIICLGVGLGFGQWRMMLTEIISLSSWIIANIVAILFVVGLYLTPLSDHLWPLIINCFNRGCLSASCDVCVARETWPLGVLIFSLIFGLAVAIPTTAALFRSGSNIWLWALGCIVAAGAINLSFMVVSTSPGFPLIIIPYAICGAPLVLGAALAPFIYVVLKEPRQLIQ